MNLKGARAGLVVAVDRLDELRGFETVASATSSTNEPAHRRGPDVERDRAATRAVGGKLPLLAALFPQFASRLIRNGATLGGNLGTGSPIGDAPPVLLALEASVVLASADGDADGAVERVLHRVPRVGPRRR